MLNKDATPTSEFQPIRLLSQSDYMIKVVDINSYTEWQTVQIQISYLLKKPTDRVLHFAKAGYIQVQQDEG